MKKIKLSSELSHRSKVSKFLQIFGPMMSEIKKRCITLNFSFINFCQNYRSFLVEFMILLLLKHNFFLSNRKMSQNYQVRVMNCLPESQNFLTQDPHTTKGRIFGKNPSKIRHINIVNGAMNIKISNDTKFNYFILCSSILLWCSLQLQIYFFFINVLLNFHAILNSFLINSSLPLYLKISLRMQLKVMAEVFL